MHLTGFRGFYLLYHLWKRGKCHCFAGIVLWKWQKCTSQLHELHACGADFFVSCINVRLPVAILIMALGYTFSFLFWACCWFALYK